MAIILIYLNTMEEVLKKNGIRTFYNLFKNKFLSQGYTLITRCNGLLGIFLSNRLYFNNMIYALL